MPKGYYGDHNWTPEQIAALEEMLEQGRSDKVIAKALGKSANAIKIVRTRRKMVCRRRLFPSARAVADRLGVSCSKTVARWIALGWLKGRRGQGAGMYRQWYVTEEALFDFLSNAAYWAAWRVEDITDTGLRLWAAELRQGDSRWLTPGQVATRYHVTVGVVNQWIRRGHVQASRYGNWWIREADLTGFVIPSERDRRGKPQRRFTPEEDTRLIVYRNSGATWAKVAEALGRDLSSCSGRYKRLAARRRYAERAA